MPICLPREMPRQISFTGVLIKTTAFLDSICSTRRPTWDGYFARNAWEHSRGSQGSKYHTVGFLNLISCQKCICSLLYYMQKYLFIFCSVSCFISLSFCFVLCKNFQTYITIGFFPHSKELQAVLFALKGAVTHSRTSRAVKFKKTQDLEMQSEL